MRLDSCVSFLIERLAAILPHEAASIVIHSILFENWSRRWKIPHQVQRVWFRKMNDVSTSRHFERQEQNIHHPTECNRASITTTHLRVLISITS